MTGEGESNETRRGAEEEMTDDTQEKNATREFLSYFWDLSESEREPRVEATEAIARRLRRAKEASEDEEENAADLGVVLTSNKFDATFFERREEKTISPSRSLDTTFHRALSYTLKRLLRGLKSSRGGSRQGFSLCLVEILESFHADLNVPAVVRKIIEYTSFSDQNDAKHARSKTKKKKKKTTNDDAEADLGLFDGKNDGQDKEESRNIRGFRRRELVFGRLFGFCALVRSHMLSIYPEICPTVLREILAIYRSKPWIREFSAQLVCDIVDDPKMTASAIRDHVIPSIASWFLRETEVREEEETAAAAIARQNGSTVDNRDQSVGSTVGGGDVETAFAAVYEPEVLNIALAIGSKCCRSRDEGDEEEEAVVVSDDPTANLLARVRYLVGHDAEDDDSAQLTTRRRSRVLRWMHALKRSDRVCPRVHSVWKRIFRRARLVVVAAAADDDDDAEEKVDKKAARSFSYDADLLSVVWSTVVDGDQGLLRSGKRERKFLALRLCAALVPQLEAQHAHLVLTSQLVNCIRTHASKPSKYLHKASNHVLDVIREQDPDFRVAVAAVLLAGGNVAKTKGKERGEGGDANETGKTNQKGADSALLQRVVDGLQPIHMERYLDCLLGNLRANLIETSPRQDDDAKGKKKKKKKKRKNRDASSVAAADESRLRARWTVRAMYSVGLALIRSATSNAASAAVGDVASATRSLTKIVDILYDIAARRRGFGPQDANRYETEEEEEEDAVPVECADCLLGLLTELGARSFVTSRESGSGSEVRFDAEAFCLRTACRLLSRSEKTAKGDEDTLSVEIRSEVERLAASREASSASSSASSVPQGKHGFHLDVFRSAYGLLLSLLGLQRLCATSAEEEEGKSLASSSGSETGLGGILSDLMRSSRDIVEGAAVSRTDESVVDEEPVSVYLDVLLGLLMQPTRKMSAMRSIVNQGFRAICPALTRAHLVDLLSIVSEPDPKRLTSAGAGLADDEEDDEADEDEDEEDEDEEDEDDEDESSEEGEDSVSESDVDPIDAAQDAAIANIIRLRQEKRRNKKRAQNLSRLGRLFQLRVLDLLERFVQYAMNSASPLVGTLPANLLAAYREATMASMRTSNRKGKASGGIGAIVDLRDRIRSIYSKRMCKRKCGATITNETLNEQIEDLLILAMTTSKQKFADMDELVTSGLLFVLRLSSASTVALSEGAFDRVVDEVVGTKRPKVNASVLTQLVQRQSNKVGWTLIPRLAAYASGSAEFVKESDVPLPRTSFQRSLCFHLLATIFKSLSSSSTTTDSSLAALEGCAPLLAVAFANVWTQIADAGKASEGSGSSIDTSLRKKSQFQSVLHFASAFCAHVQRAYGLGGKDSVSNSKKRKMRKKKRSRQEKEGDGAASKSSDEASKKFPPLPSSVKTSLRRMRTSIQTKIRALVDANRLPTSIGKSATSLSATIERILDKSESAAMPPASKRSRIDSSSTSSSSKKKELKKRKKKKTKKRGVDVDDAGEIDAVSETPSKKAKRSSSSQKKRRK